MGDFFVHLAEPAPNGTSPPLRRIAEELTKIPMAETSSAHDCPGCSIVMTTVNGRTPQLIDGNGGSLVVILKGIMFDPHGAPAPLDTARLLQEIRDGNDAALARYEGSFACFAWDGRRRRGWIFNDQTSQVNLYHLDRGDELFLGTNALALARGLGLGLDPAGVQDFLCKGIMYAPRTVFAGLKRLNVGEVLYRDNGRSRLSRIWDPVPRSGAPLRRTEALASVQDLVVDRLQRYRKAHAGEPRVVCDITGGYDSRLLAAACLRAGLDLTLTVNGPPSDEDVRIGHEAAAAAKLDLAYFNTDTYDLAAINVSRRRELLYRSNGEFPFVHIVHHPITRARLSETFDIHFSGGGGELFRYRPWSHELLGIGARRRIKVDHTLRFYYAGKRPPAGLYVDNWYPAYWQRLHDDVTAIVERYPDSLTTEQLDAAYVWRKTSNPSVYLSAMFAWMPSVCPFMNAKVVQTLTSIHWPLRLTGRFQRQVIQNLNPNIAAVRTAYGGTGAPPTVLTLHREAGQMLSQTNKLLYKLNKVAFKNRLYIPAPSKGTPFVKRGLFPDIKSLLDLREMRSAPLYQPQALQALADGSAAEQAANHDSIEAIVNIELICRELDFTPEANFLSQ